MNTLSKIIIITFILLSVYSCAKKDDTTSASSSTPQPTVTSFSVNGAAANSPIPGASRNGSNFIVQATDASYGYPQIKITFPDTLDPISGPYTIVHAATSPFCCSFLLTTSTSSTLTPTATATASSGVVTITETATPSNTATFNNILCTGTSGTTTTTYTVSGIIKY